MCAIFNFTMLTQYLLHNNETIFYMNNTLDKLKKEYCF